MSSAARVHKPEWLTASPGYEAPTSMASFIKFFCDEMLVVKELEAQVIREENKRLRSAITARKRLGRGWKIRT